MRCWVKLHKKIEYRPDIDGLRAIAVLMVLAVHASPASLPNGYVGVDLFFVISGYLITSILQREITQGQFSIRDFYVRRINRIFPALVLVLLVCLTTGLALMYASEYRPMSKAALFSVLFSANVHFYMESGYWDVASKLKPLLHLWSLGVEEQFYLLWPVLLFWAHRTRRSVLNVALIVVFASLVVNLVLTSKNQAAGFYLPFGRLWELAAGGCVACISWLRLPAVEPGVGVADGRAFRNILGWAGMGLLAATQLSFMASDAFPGFYVVPVVLAATMLIWAGPQASFNRRVLSHPVAVYIGKISYPLYLWHWPLLVSVRLLGDGQWSSSHRNLAVLTSVLLAMLTYHAMEKPLAIRVVRKNVLAMVLLGLMAITGALAWMGSAGMVPLTAAPYANAGLLAYDKPTIQSHGRIALVGDSNAGHLVYGLSLLYGDRLDVTATPGWPYLDGVGYRPGFVPHPEHVGTPAMTEAALQRIESDPDIRVVVLANAYRMYFGLDSLRSVKGGGSEETASQAYERGLRQTVERLLARKKKVVLVKSIPTYSAGLTVTACTSEVRPAWRREPADCVRSRDSVDAERQEYDRVVQRVVGRQGDVWVLDTLNELCDDRYCYVNRNGIQMYIDPGHFTTAGSQLMAAALARKIEDALKD